MLACSFFWGKGASATQEEAQQPHSQDVLQSSDAVVVEDTREQSQDQPQEVNSVSEVDTTADVKTLDENHHETGSSTAPQELHEESNVQETLSKEQERVQEEEAAPSQQSSAGETVENNIEGQEEAGNSDQGSSLFKNAVISLNEGDIEEYLSLLVQVSRLNGCILCHINKLL